MSGEMELEQLPQGFGAEHADKVVVVILPDEPALPIPDSITLDGDPNEGGKGLPEDLPQDETDLPGDPYDVGKGLG